MRKERDDDTITSRSEIDILENNRLAIPLALADGSRV